MAKRKKDQEGIAPPPIKLLTGRKIVLALYGEGLLYPEWVPGDAHLFESRQEATTALLTDIAYVDKFVRQILGRRPPRTNDRFLLDTKNLEKKYLYLVNPKTRWK